MPLPPALELDPPSLPEVSVAKADFMGNYEATDRFWYYQDHFGYPITRGGTYPEPEIDDDRTVGPAVVGVAYKRAESVVVKVKIKNDNYFSIDVMLTDIESKYEEFENWDTPHSVDVDDDDFSIPANSYSQWLTFTCDGMPDVVDLGWFWVDAKMEIVVPGLDYTEYVNPLHVTMPVYLVDDDPTGLMEVV